MFLKRLFSFYWKCLGRDILVKKWLGHKTSLGSTSPICECEEETMEYAIFLYGQAKTVWFGSILNFLVHSLGIYGHSGVA